MKHIVHIGAVICVYGFFFFLTSPVQALSAMVSVPEKYAEVTAGDRVYFGVEIKYPENVNRKDITLIYQIKQKNEIIAESKVLKAIETQASFIDYIVVPDSAKSGLYTISIKIADYESLNQNVSATFKVMKKFSPFLIYFFIILGSIFVLGIIISLEINRLKTYLT